MVCSKCEAKLPKLCVGDKWRDAKSMAARKTTSATSGPIKTAKSSGADTASGAGGGPALGLRPCRLCKAKVHLEGAWYCHQCAYKNGICAMCGTRVLDTSSYKMSSR
jgi:hypothetical protein